MDNFFNYITKNLDPEEVDIWFRVNNIIPEKMELYYDFSYSLFLLIKKTYLGDNQSNNETKVEMTDEDNTKHFKWCWDKTLYNFKKESIEFEKSKIDLELAQKMLKEYPCTKWFARIGFVIEIVLAVLEIIQWKNK